MASISTSPSLLNHNNNNNNYTTNISAIMPTFEPRISYISHAIQQFYQSNIKINDTNQTITIELIIIDDSIINKEHDIIKQTKNHLTKNIYITYIHLNHTASIGEKRNIGIKNANGNIIILIDDDDTYFPNRIMQQCHSLLLLHNTNTHNE